MASRESVIERDVREIIRADLPWESLAGKTVLVSGASGMIPSYVVHTLLALNDERRVGMSVVGVVRNEDKARRILAGVMDRPDFQLLTADVQDKLDIKTPVDLVVHGASPARPALHAIAPVDTIRANVQGTFNMLDLCRQSNEARFVLMSSAEVYGSRTADDGVISEGDYGAVDILNPRACYTEGKRAAETIAISYNDQYHVPITIARFGHIFGPGMPLDDGRVQADFAADVIAKRNITLNSDGSARRTYTYVADAVLGMFFAMFLGEDTAYNVADEGGFMSIRDLAERFTQTRPQHEIAVEFRPGVDHSQYNSVKGQGLDNTRLRGLGWSPVVGVTQGLDRTIAWHEERIRTK